MHWFGYKSHSNRPALMPHRLLFPMAAVFAIVAIPAWIVLQGNPAAPVKPAWHGHEMLFGFTLAVIAGFLCTRPAHALLWVLVGTWLGARIAAAIGSGPLALIAGLAFPITVFCMTVPPLLAGAKRWENRILPAILAGLVTADAVWWAGMTGLGSHLQIHALLSAVDLIALLLLIIGGRALRAAVGGHLERQGIARRDHTRHRYELALALVVGGAALFDAFAVNLAAGILLITAALLTLLRVVPWQLYRTTGYPHLWSLVLGYLWLVPGLATKGFAQLSGYVPVAGMLHGICIGAAGTLTLVMMARTATLRAHKPIEHFADIGVAAILISTAALSRLSAPFTPAAAQHGLLWLAALAWVGAFLILLARLWRTARLK